MPGYVLLAATLLASAAFGLWWQRRDGRTRAVAEDARLSEADLALLGITSLGERATLVQFSSAFCAPCRATRRVLADVAEVVPGVSHVEVDAEHHLEAVRRLDVHRTPTTLVLDAEGREVSRAVGAPRKEQVLAALAPVLD